MVGLREMAKNDLRPNILFITPPFTQLNTPYPATIFLKGFLKTIGIASNQCDLGIEVISFIFSAEGVEALFGEVEKSMRPLSANARRMVQLLDDYIHAIDPVMEFLRGNNPELAHLICGRKWLPEASRFGQTTDVARDFGNMGIHDRAKYLATLFIEDLSDLIVEAVDPHFGFSRYAERLGRSASSFDDLKAELGQELPERFIDGIMTGILQQKITDHGPAVVALSVPFPGNIYSALKCGQWIKQHHPNIQVVMGGGFVNTELRSLSDPRVFEYVDFITLDDGEMPLLNLMEHFAGTRKREDLKRTFAISKGSVVFFNGSKDPDLAQKDAGIPDYSGLPLNKYLSVIEMANPMHRLWGDGRWNKLMLAHGCYWGKCTFCDVTLDYIKRYEPNKPSAICDRMESIIAQTKHHGFHFTDEAAPPGLLRDVALEILRRKLTVAWWTNIRFETNFTPDLCLLLKKSGCIAVSGGLEVASDRILKMINKGVTVSQVARVAANFTMAGIMVHAYLMYGFPTQTEQETIDSLEVVRQLFMNGAVQSGFWHQFAMTAHSPVGLDPQKFGVAREEAAPGRFANNDLVPIDMTGCDHESFGDGLKKAMYNYMHGICFDFPLQEWFGFRVPRTTIAPNFIRKIIFHELLVQPNAHSKVIFVGSAPLVTFFTRHKKGNSIPSARITIQTPAKEVTIQTTEIIGRWLMDIFPRLTLGNHDLPTFGQLEELFKASGLGDFKTFRDGMVFRTLRENGLLVV